ncbi:NAD-dependent epimerase/dehydratase family protein [Conexibacter woesei]|uniref:NAD-dependent epimerase/dehydratase n=1 Tax=Conexibacter woesei (strain DSM 14684 / CCUG 47730 / CIP 108061 / JCM 11494 / NBRC 100937 / ID131577) TaxID=469383 RepID=D3FF90_CONWI|nr:NAD(P)H-binding protein [Conexibacter woesei]ADB53683.1 NAD-dependent epimerase/dehydratase [Conexibacter woesei DSM 14684]
MRILITGVSGFVGSRLVPRLRDDGHELRGFARDAARVTVDVPLAIGDAVTGTGLAAALDGVEVAYFLIHSMEPPPANGDQRPDPFADRERRAAERFADAAAAAGVRRIVYLGGLVPEQAPASTHLASRLAVERVLLDAVPDSIALRASIVIGARSRSFRFLVRLIERMPVLALPGWRDFRTRPIDERDVVELLAHAASAELPPATGRSLDIAGPDVVSYRELIERIRDLLLLDRPVLALDPPAPASITSRIAAAIAGEQHALVGPLMAGLSSDLLPRTDDAAALLGVRLHRLDAAIEHALGEWEREEPLAAR